MSRRVANLLLLIAGATWGMGFIAQSTAMDDISALLFIGLRFLLAGLVVLPLAIREQRKHSVIGSLSLYKPMVMVGVTFFIAMTLQQYGLLTTTVTNAGFLTALYVVIVPLLLTLFLGEQQPLIIWPAAMLALFGIYLLSGGDLTVLTTGDYLVTIGAFFWALQVILTAKVVMKTGLPVTLACTQFLVCALLALVAQWFIAPMAAEPSVLQWSSVKAAAGEIIYAGVFAGALAFTLQAVAQQYTSAAAAAILLSSESLFAALFGAWLLQERLAVISYLGCGLIFVALLLVELRSGVKRKTANV